MTTKTTIEEDIFVLNVLTPDVSMAEAYKRAYNKFGTDSKVATTAAARLLDKTHIKKKLQERHKAMTEKLEITAEKIEQEVAAIAFGKVTDVLTWQNTDEGVKVEVKDSYALSDTEAALIKSFKVNDKGVVEVVFHDKQRALDTLGKRFRRFNEVTEIEEITPEQRFASMSPEEKMARIKELEEKMAYG